MSSRPDFNIVQHDTRPTLDRQLLDANGNPVDLTGIRDVVFNMSQGSTVAVSRKAATVVGTATNGNVRYTWTTGDTATAGVFQGEFEVTFSDGGVETFPNPTKIQILITADIA